MNSKKIIVIDFDGTIISSGNIWIKIYKEYCLANNLTPLELVDELFGIISFEEWINMIIDSHNISLDYDVLLYDIYKFAIKQYCDKEPNKGFKEYINHNKQNTIIVISKEEPMLIESYLKYYGIESIQSILQDKNDNRSNCCFYSNIAKKYDCIVNEMVLIDDSLSHCSAAQEAGAFVIGIDDCHTFERQKQMKKTCDIYVNSFAEISNI